MCFFFTRRIENAHFILATLVRRNVGLPDAADAIYTGKQYSRAKTKVFRCDTWPINNGLYLKNRRSVFQLQISLLLFCVLSVNEYNRRKICYVFSRDTRLFCTRVSAVFKIFKIFKIFRELFVIEIRVILYTLYISENILASENSRNSREKYIHALLSRVESIYN